MTRILQALWPFRKHETWEEKLERIEMRVAGVTCRQPYPTLAARFWAKVDKDSADQCWNWTGCQDKHGYGYIGLGTREQGVERASRVVWFLTHDEWPNGFVLHKCDNPKCVNPAHLFLGTHADNMRDMVAKRRHARHAQTHCINGHEFTPENVYISPRGARVCRTCTRVAGLNYYYRKRAA